MTSKLFYRVLFVWVNSRIRVSEPLIGIENWDFGRTKIKIDIWEFWVKGLMAISGTRDCNLGEFIYLFIFLEEQKDNETVALVMELF